MDGADGTIGLLTFLVLCVRVCVQKSQNTFKNTRDCKAISKQVTAICHLAFTPTRVYNIIL